MEDVIANSPFPEENHKEEAPVATGSKTAAQCSVAAVYQAKVAGKPRNVTVIWSKSLINHSLSITIDRIAEGGSGGCSEAPYAACRIDLKPWPFWGKKGFKSLDIDGHRADLFWDLRSAKFATSGPEPTGGYYVALVYKEEVVLLLGDSKKEAYKRTRSRPSLEDAAMVSKRDNVFGKRCFSTRARFAGGKKEHEIVVENSISCSSGGAKDPEMWISIDGAVAIHVSSLQWKFRGNETVVVEDSQVQVLWDVHDWLYGGQGMGQALFIFKPGAVSTPAPTDGEERRAEDAPIDVLAAAQNECGRSSEFCFFLHAWRTE